MKPRVLVIQNEESDPPGLVATWLGEQGVELDVVRAFAGEEVPSQIPAGYSGIMAFGGAMGANDDADHPWLTQERLLMQDAIVHDAPMFGICLGAQMLATATGGVVGRAQVIEIGVSTFDVYDSAESDEVFSSLVGKSVQAAQWHQDGILELPDDAVVLAGSDDCPVQAFRIGTRVYGVQFHPEVDADTFSEWSVVGDEAAQRSGTDVQVATAQVKEAETQLIETWRPIFHAWADVVKGYSVTDS
ncbi:MAG: type 1 glutamine amidotransferase [Actinomycetes bacterium]